MSKLNWDKVREQNLINTHGYQDISDELKQFRKRDRETKKTRNKADIAKFKQKQRNKSRNDTNILAMKVASGLYKRLKQDPEFADMPWKELWQIAVDEVKRRTA